MLASVEVAGRLASVEVAVRHLRFGARTGLFVVVGVLCRSCGGKRVDWQRSVDREKGDNGSYVVFVSKLLL